MLADDMTAAVIVALAPYVTQPLEERLAALDAAAQILASMADLEDQLKGKLVQAPTSGA